MKLAKKGPVLKKSYFTLIQFTWPAGVKQTGVKQTHSTKTHSTKNYIYR